MKGQWTEEEDTKLKALVAAHGEGCWSRLVDYFPGRIGKQLRERWNHELAPNINKDAWSREEEAILVSEKRRKRGVFFSSFFFLFIFFPLFFPSFHSLSKKRPNPPSGRRPRPRRQLLGWNRPSPARANLQRREKPLERHAPPLRPRRARALRSRSLGGLPAHGRPKGAGRGEEARGPQARRWGRRGGRQGEGGARAWRWR